MGVRPNSILSRLNKEPFPMRNTALILAVAMLLLSNSVIAQSLTRDAVAAPDSTHRTITPVDPSPPLQSAPPQVPSLHSTDLLSGEFATLIRTDISLTNRIVIQRTISSKNIRPFYVKKGVLMLTYRSVHHQSITSIRLRVGSTANDYFEYAAYPEASERASSGMHTVAFPFPSMLTVAGAPNIDRIRNIQIVVNYQKDQTETNFSLNRLWVQESSLRSILRTSTGNQMIRNAIQPCTTCQAPIPVSDPPIHPTKRTTIRTLSEIISA